MFDVRQQYSCKQCHKQIAAKSSFRVRSQYLFNSRRFSSEAVKLSSPETVHTVSIHFRSSACQQIMMLISKQSISSSIFSSLRAFSNPEAVPKQTCNQCLSQISVQVKVSCEPSPSEVMDFSLFRRWGYKAVGGFILKDATRSNYSVKEQIFNPAVSAKRAII